MPRRPSATARGKTIKRREEEEEEDDEEGGGEKRRRDKHARTHTHEQKEMSEKIDGEDQREEEDMER